MRKEELESSIKLQVPSFKAQDSLIEANLGMEEELKTTKGNGLLAKEDRNRLIDLIKQYKDYFSWNNCEVPGLSRELVEHRLLIKEGFKPHKQPQEDLIQTCTPGSNRRLKDY